MSCLGRLPKNRRFLTCDSTTLTCVHKKRIQERLSRCAQRGSTATLLHCAAFLMRRPAAPWQWPAAGPRQRSQMAVQSCPPPPNQNTHTQADTQKYTGTPTHIAAGEAVHLLLVQGANGCLRLLARAVHDEGKPVGRGKEEACRGCTQLTTAYHGLLVSPQCMVNSSQLQAALGCKRCHALQGCMGMRADMHGLLQVAANLPFDLAALVARHAQGNNL